MTRQNFPPKLASELERKLRWPVRLTWAGMGVERAWHAFWPLVTVALIGFAIWRFVGLGAVSLGIFGILALATLIWGARQFSWPDAKASEARVDAALPGAPLAALRDTPVPHGNDPISQDIWAVHQARMAQIASRARAVAPDLGIAAKDPFGLRLMAVVAAVMAVGFATPPPATKSASPAATCADCPAGVTWEGWIEPPAYTGHPSLYLNDQPAGLLPVPVGSQLILRLYGEAGRDLIRGDLLADIPWPHKSDADTSAATDLSHRITQSGSLQLGPAGPIWRLSAIGDQPPGIRADGEMTFDVSGNFAQGFMATDDYGVTQGEAQIALNLDQVDRRFGLALPPDPRPEVTVDLPRPYRGDLRQIDEVWEENLVEHHWAGLPVILTLVAHDGAGQMGLADPITRPLPSRRFFAPSAKAVIEMRRDLLWARAGAARVALILRAALHRPADLSLPDGVYLSLRAVIRQLEQSGEIGPTAALQKELAATLWDIAVQIDENGLGDARERLARAQERLEQAIEEGATPEELAELMDELRDATQDYLERLAQSPEADQESPDGTEAPQMEMSAADLQAMMDQIEQMMREGRMEEAMDMLETLKQMMENMQVAQGDNPSSSESAREGLAQTLRNQQGLSDEAFRDLQEQSGQGNEAGSSDGNTGRDGGQGRGQSHSGDGGEQGENGQQGAGLAQRQRDLQRELEEQQRQLPGVGSEAGNAARDSLGEAGRAMGDAADALEQGDLSGALDRQAEALEAMREGMRRFDEAMDNQQANREGQQGQAGTESGQQNARDPLGRDSGSQLGRSASDGGLADREDLRKRAQELADELRRRSGDVTRSEDEREYLERLLEQF